MSKVFISHSTKDREFVEKELVPLLEHHGIETWFSLDDIRTAEQWDNAIHRNLRSCDWFLVVLSPDAVSSQWVKAETSWALDEKLEKVIPLFYRTCNPDTLNLKLRLIQSLDYQKDTESARKRLLAVWGVQYDPTSSLPLYPSRRLMSWLKIAATLTLSLVAIGMILMFQFRTSSKRAEQPSTNASYEPAAPIHVSPSLLLDRQLTALSEALSRLHKVVGIYIDPATGALILVGTAQPQSTQAPLLLEDLAFCLHWSTVLDRLPFGCALDLPPKQTNQWSFSVRCFGDAENTHVGLALFQADLALKEYIIGQRIDGTRIQSSVQAYPSMLQLFETQDVSSDISAARFWFKTAPSLQVSGDGLLAVVTTPGISLAYEAQNWQEGEFIRSSESKESYHRLSLLFSEHFKEFADEEPSFAWLDRFTSVTALAVWAAKSKEIGQITWTGPLAVRKYSIPTSVPLVVSRLERKETLPSGVVVSTLTALAGGVSSINPDGAKIIRGDTEMTRTIQAALPPDLSRYQIGTTLKIDTPDQRYMGIVLHSTASEALTVSPLTTAQPGAPADAEEPRR